MVYVFTRVFLMCARPKARPCHVKAKTSDYLQRRHTHPGYTILDMHHVVIGGGVV